MSPDSTVDARLNETRNVRPQAVGEKGVRGRVGANALRSRSGGLASVPSGRRGNLARAAVAGSAQLGSATEAAARRVRGLRLVGAALGAMAVRTPSLRISGARNHWAAMDIHLSKVRHGGVPPMGTPWRFQPLQPPPSEGGLAGVVHLPTGPTGGAAAVRSPRLGGLLSDRVRLNSGQPRL